jgi:hypothetical protein
MGEAERITLEDVSRRSTAEMAFSRYAQVWDGLSELARQMNEAFYLLDDVGEDLKALGITVQVEPPSPLHEAWRSYHARKINERNLER